MSGKKFRKCNFLIKSEPRFVFRVKLNCIKVLQSHRTKMTKCKRNRIMALNECHSAKSSLCENGESKTLKFWRCSDILIGAFCILLFANYSNPHKFTNEKDSTTGKLYWKTLVRCHLSHLNENHNHALWIFGTILNVNVLRPNEPNETMKVNRMIREKKTHTQMNGALNSNLNSFF